MCIDSRSLIKLLKQNGWEHAKGRGKGDHEIYTKEGFPPIAVPHPRKDLATGTLHSILKVAGLK
jgi:predicted RNA binding protein YcfA (HicA-like mRNA interferase family)